MIEFLRCKKECLLNIITPIFFLVISNYQISNAQLIEYATPEKLPETVNSDAEESLPLFSPENKTLYFVRSLNARNVKGKLGGQDIWGSTKKNGTWTEASNNFGQLNTKGNNAIVGINSSGNRIYLLNTYKKFSKGISYSELKNGLWTSPIPLQLKNINPNSLFYGFYMHPSEKILLVSMDAGGSIGKEDLYVILKENSGEWGDPIHLGPTINTSGYEISPFLSEDGTTLYFSSNGHSGLGSADIYMSKRLYKSWDIWTKPSNLGENINSKQFDAYFSVTADSTIYFTSNRDGKLTDIYQSKIIKKDISEILELDELSDTPDPNKELQKVDDKEVNEFLGVSIPRLVYFKLNSFEITPEDKELIFYIAGKIENEKKYYLEIVGHTDEEGSPSHNMELSIKRAEAVKDYFASLGISPSRMYVEGKGSTQPIEKSPNKRNEKNRRVEINFLK